MNLDEYQRLALRTAGRFRDNVEKMTCAMLGLCGEAGETADLWKKVRYHGLTVGEQGSKLVEELGDALWYLALAADALDVSLEAVAVRNIEKLTRRYPDGFKPKGGAP